MRVNTNLKQSKQNFINLDLKNYNQCDAFCIQRPEKEKEILRFIESWRKLHVEFNDIACMVDTFFHLQVPIIYKTHHYSCFKYLWEKIPGESNVEQMSIHICFRELYYWMKWVFTTIFGSENLFYCLLGD